MSGLGDDVLAVADDHLGTPYVFSPPGPCVAFEAEDCSCFTMLVFQEFGIALPDSPGGQMGYGTPVTVLPRRETCSSGARTAADTSPTSA